MRTNKNTSKIILAVIVAFLATMISYSAFSNMNGQLTDQQKMIEAMQKTKASQYNDTYAYAVATKDLKAGEIVADGDVDFKQFPTKNSYAFEDRSEVINKVLLQDISSGTMFTNTYIAKVSSDSVSLRDGYRALTLPADNFQGRSSKMVAGSNVDIYSASSDSNWTLENVKIMSFEGGKAPVAGAKGSSGGDITTASSITFEVSADRIADFISNISKGKLVLVVRNSSDKRVSHKSPRVSSFSGNFGGSGGGGGSSLPNLPSTVPISNFPSGKISGLPQPIKPEPAPQTVEMIEANVKSKVTFD